MLASCLTFAQSICQVMKAPCLRLTPHLYVCLLEAAARIAGSLWDIFHDCIITLVATISCSSAVYGLEDTCSAWCTAYNIVYIRYLYMCLFD